MANLRKSGMVPFGIYPWFQIELKLQENDDYIWIVSYPIISFEENDGEQSNNNNKSEK